MPELMVLLSVEQYDMERRQMVMMNGHRASRFEFINNFQIPEAFVNELFDFCEEIRTEKYCRSIIAILAALTLFSSDRGYPKELDNGKFQFLTHTVYVIRYESYLISALRFNICVQKIVQKPDSDWPQNSPYPNRFRYKSRITPEDLILALTRISTTYFELLLRFIERHYSLDRGMVSKIIATPSQI